MYCRYTKTSIWDHKKCLNSIISSFIRGSTVFTCSGTLVDKTACNGLLASFCIIYNYFSENPKNFYTGPRNDHRDQAHQGMLKFGCMQSLDWTSGQDS